MSESLADRRSVFAFKVDTFGCLPATTRVLNDPRVIHRVFRRIEVRIRPHLAKLVGAGSTGLAGCRIYIRTVVRVACNVEYSFMD